MIAPTPHMPENLAQKLIVAARSFQRDYDAMTLAEARRLLGRHDFRVPVLCSLTFHGNGNLKQVNVRENLKCKAPFPRQFVSSIRIFATPEQGANDLRSGCFRWIAEDAAERFLTERRHRAFQLSDGEIEALLRRIPEYAPYKAVDFEDVCLLAIRRIVETEHELRRGESKHARLFRHAQKMPSGFITDLEEERADARSEWDEDIAKGYTPFIPFAYRSWPEEEAIVLAQRQRTYEALFR
ncbi:hypothetical protein [Pseudooceanicola aestuarii]|uniref:hypothetical protein n=1 Tax=Pseudooceanicola aestuarii TaxID=2697319 RepID=UPI0013D66043|nr:hypothetical protein [Pseudooceanicola aestuarii]